MEDSFRVRADKVFGGLGGGDTTSSVGVSSSLWCLGDEEIERREWNRSKGYTEEGGGEEPVESGPSVVRSPIESDLQDLSCEEEEEREEGDEEIDGGKRKRRRSCSSGVAESSVDEYLEVQSNIGRDCTLDFEEEEDHYDKVAVGMEETGDRLYMKDVKVADYEIHELNEHNELPITFQAVVRDPRANHTAAKIRLKEDAEAAGNFDTLQLSDNLAATNAETNGLKKRELDGGDNPKPILKKGENLMDSRSQKRVRFVFDSKSSTKTSRDDELALKPCASEDGTVPEQAASDLSLYSSGVPDYLRNPTKYTRYTFDSSNDVDEHSNRKAYLEFFDQLRNRNAGSSMDDTPVETTPKSVVFTPRRKTEEGSMAKRSERENRTGDNLKNKRCSVAITAEDSQESGVSAMEEDEPCQAVDEGRSSQRGGRRYRARTNVDVDVDDNLN